MKERSRLLTVIFFSLAILGLGALAVGKSALGFIVSSQGDQQVRLVQDQNVVSKLVFDNFAQGTFSDPLITLVKPLAPLREDTPFAPTVLPTDPVQGEGEITMVLFCDHLSEACRQAVSVARQFVGANGRSPARLIWKDFPNPLDPASRPAALAARCAKKQDKFWEFHDALTPSVSPLLRGRGSGGQNYAIIVKELGLDAEKFNACVDSRATTDLVNRGMDEAQALDIDGIPALFVGHYRLSGNITEEEIEKVISLQNDQ